MDKHFEFELGTKIPNQQIVISDNVAEKRLWKENLLLARQLGNRKRSKAESIIRVIHRSHWATRKLAALSLHSDFTFRELTIDISRGHSADYIRILHLSDIHLDLEAPCAKGQSTFTESFYQFVTGLPKSALEADIAVITGDLQDRIGTPLSPTLISALGKTLKHLKCPIISVLGNHDSLNTYSQQNTSLLQQSCPYGFSTLINQICTVTKNNKPFLEIHGADDTHYYKTYGKLPQAEGNTPKLLLAHSPIIADEASSAGYQLCLSGHTHAGQIRIPGISSTRWMKQIHKDKHHGLWRVGEMFGYTSAGIGCSGLPIRLRTKPEIVKITVKLPKTK